MINGENIKLTPREREVLALVARGLTNQEIAQQLFISMYAVKISLHQAYGKLGARNRAQAVIFAFKKRAIALQDVFSLEEIAEMEASLGPEAIETIARLLKEKLKVRRAQSGVKPT